MDIECLDVGKNMDQDQPDKKTDLKTSDVYRVNENLPNRFNNPDCFKGYGKKMDHPLYQTTSQIYGGKKPTVHEMPTAFHGFRIKFSEHMIKCGRLRDNGFNTWLEKSVITEPHNIHMTQDRIMYHHSYHTGGNDQAETNMI